MTELTLHDLPTAVLEAYREDIEDREDTDTIAFVELENELIDRGYGCEVAV